MDCTLLHYQKQRQSLKKIEQKQLLHQKMIEIYLYLLQLLYHSIILTCNIFRNHMQRQAEINSLSKKGDAQMNEGRYAQAIQTYDKILLILKELRFRETSLENIQIIQNKMDKYIHLIQEANAKKKLQPQKQPQKSPNILHHQKSDPKGVHIQYTPSVIVQPTKPIIHEPKKIEPYVPPKIEVKIPQKQQINPHHNPHNQKKPIQNPHSKDEKIDPAVQQLIIHNLDVSFKDIVGLEEAKSILEQSVIRPRKRPDLYTGIRAPPRGLLLYGPPGNGKTYICKALAKQSGCTFIALSASSILNKYVGQSQKTIKKIFEAGQKLAPTIIFIDEIDSMLTARSQNQHQASRRLKTEFLVQMDGINSAKSGEILVIGATNLPKQLDNAAKRRFNKFIYIPNPDQKGRKEMLHRNLTGIQYDLSQADINKIVEHLNYYSASQIRNIIAQVSMIPLRQLTESKFQKISSNDIRKVNVQDFISVLKERKPIVSKQDLQKYKEKI